VRLLSARLSSDHPERCCAAAARLASRCPRTDPDRILQTQEGDVGQRLLMAVVSETDNSTSEEEGKEIYFTEKCKSQSDPQIPGHQPSGLKGIPPPLENGCTVT